MNQLNSILKEATAGIDSLFMRLPVDGGDGQYRERVYCYELYHQMRLRWPSNCKYTINGEVDKRGHPIRALSNTRAIPDFLVHKPGNMEGNYAIIEVKSALAEKGPIRTDLRKLSRFLCPDIHYQRAIYLFFGGANVERLRQIVWEREFASLPPVEIWIHNAPGQPAYLSETIQSHIQQRNSNPHP